jgi:protein-disulfide isomerase
MEENLPIPPENPLPKRPRREDTDLVQPRQPYVVLLIPLAFMLGILAGYLVWGRGTPGATRTQASGEQSAVPAVAQDTSQQTKPTRYNIPAEGYPSLGPANAPITMVEFSDYQCPYCRKWHQEVFQKLMDTYSGKIRMVYRDFPLTTIHSEAFSAAEAADCAGEQGVYWKFSDKLFNGDPGLGQTAYTRYAQDLGLEMGKFSGCLDSHKYQKNVQANFDFAANLGVTSTPTFFINGIALVGAQPYEVFKGLIDKELAGQLQ